MNPLAAAGRSALHAARAGVSAAWCLALTVVALSFDHPVVLASLLLVVVAVGAAAGVGRSMLRTALFCLPFAVTVAVINPFVVRDGLTVIARLGTLPVLGRLDVTLEATAYGGILGLRALVVLLSFVVFSKCVDPDRLLRAFRRISFRSALTAALATRLVPVLARDARRLQDAQRVRAGEPAPRLAILRAVTTGALERSVDVAATLEVRGYGSARRPPRTTLPWSRHDLAFAASAFALVALTAGSRLGGVAHFDAYPRLEASLGPAEALLIGALALVALLPFADRRGIGA